MLLLTVDKGKNETAPYRSVTQLKHMGTKKNTEMAANKLRKNGNRKMIKSGVFKFEKGNTPDIITEFMSKKGGY